MEKFNSIHIDLEKGIYEINGQDMAHAKVAELDLIFNNGSWLMTLVQILEGQKKRRRFKGSTWL